MTHLVHCAKLKKELEGLAQPPLPGELGKRIHEQISREAWQMWLNHQTMLINEYRLSMIEPKSRTFLLQEMERFLFGEGSEKPPGYNP
jgi:Fe-S cluster biosynthesis and repair protein YggX